MATELSGLTAHAVSESLVIGEVSGGMLSPRSRNRCATACPSLPASAESLNERMRAMVARAIANRIGLLQGNMAHDLTPADAIWKTQAAEPGTAVKAYFTSRFSQ